MTTATLTRQPVDSVLANLRADAEKQYQEIVLRLASGEAVSPTDLQDALRGANRTEDELRRHTAIAMERREDEEFLRGEPARLEHLESLQTEKAAIGGKIAELTRVYREQLAPLNVKLNAANDAYRVAMDDDKGRAVKARRLLATTAHPSVTTRLNVLANSVTAINDRLSELRRREEWRSGEIAQLTTDIEAQSARVQSLAGRPEVTNAHRTAVAQLKDLQQSLDAISAESDEQSSCETQLAAARTAHDSYEAGEFLDWRNMRFE